MKRRNAGIGAGLLAVVLVGAVLANTGRRSDQAAATRVEGIRARKIVPAPLPTITPRSSSDGGATVQDDCISSYGHAVERDSAGHVVVTLDIHLKTNPATPAELAAVLDSAACRAIIPRVVRNLHDDMVAQDGTQVLRISYHTARGARIIVP